MTYPPQDPDLPHDPNAQQPGYGYPPPAYPQQGYPQQGYPPPAYGQPPAYGPPGYMPPPPPGMMPYGMMGAPVPGGRLASMSARFGGLVLDFLILLVPNLIIVGITGGFHTNQQTCDYAGCTNSTGFSFFADPLALLLGTMISLAYYGYMVGVRTQTWGHQAAGIRVVNVTTGSPIGFWPAVLRSFVLQLTGALCTLGYWSPYFDPTRRQGWHDKSAGAVVIPAAGH